MPGVWVASFVALRKAVRDYGDINHMSRWAYGDSTRMARLDHDSEAARNP